MILISTFRLAMQIHTRSANAKWLNEIAHTNPLWLHPSHASKLNLVTGDLVRVDGGAARGPARISPPLGVIFGYTSVRNRVLARA